jgi:signal transduction histidine kinase
MTESPLPRPWRLALVVVAVATGVPALWLGSPLPAAAALVVAQAVAAWFLPVRPRPATLLVMLTSTALQFVAPPIGPGMLFVVLCSYAWLRPARESLAGLAVGIVLASGPAALRDRWDLAAIWLAACLLAWSWGALGRAAGARREAERRRAVLEERARIARELHDVLSHTVSLMVVQTAAADDVFEIDPARARQAVRSAEEAGRSALAELRLFLRTVSDPEDLEVQPQPSLADLAGLVSTMADAGLPVRLRREGDGEVPAAVQLSAYRIVQESLTNTLRHAAASGADVLLRVTPGELLIEVRDDGTSGNGRPGAAGARGGAEDRRAAAGAEGEQAGAESEPAGAESEQAGAAAERGRADAETEGARADPETEGARADPETEGARADPETEGARADPETEGARASAGAEGARASAGAEDKRASAETEGARASAGAEDKRASAETEGARASAGAEDKRASAGAEGGRASAEGGRTGARNGRTGARSGRAGAGTGVGGGLAGVGGRRAAAGGENGGGGRGIAGMRERARLLGGTLTAGPDAGGFVVSARLPWKVN